MTGPQLDKQQQKFIQELIKTFLHYARAVNGTMLTALSALATKQATPTETTKKKTRQFLDYAASNSDTTLTYNVSNMVLVVHSDTSYLNKERQEAEQVGIFHVNHRHISHKQWCSPQHSANHKSSHHPQQKQSKGCSSSLQKKPCP